MIYDLHTHSTASDGELSPVELFERAARNSVDVLALTDHDTVDGVLSLQQSLQQGELASAVELVAGVEITTQASGLCVHVVGLWIDTENTELRQLLSSQLAVREQRAAKIGLRLQKQGFGDAFAGARSIAGSAALGRPHFARYLVQQGYCANERQAFRRWLGRGKIGEVKCQWPELTEVISAIHSAGGRAVLAHPDKYRLTRSKLDALLGEFRLSGGDAVELISGAQAGQTTADLCKLIQKHALSCSTGSDFHSPEQIWCDLGQQAQLPTGVQPVWQGL